MELSRDMDQHNSRSFTDHFIFNDRGVWLGRIRLEWVSSFWQRPSLRHRLRYCLHHA